jgi:hypothetical protein
MHRTLLQRRDSLVAAARGHGFDENLAHPDGLRLLIEETSDGDARTILRLEVKAPLTDAFPLRLRRLTLARSLAALFGTKKFVASGDQATDRLALIEGDDAVRARAAFKAGLSASVRSLLEAFPDAELRATSTSLVIGFEAREGALPALLEIAQKARAALEAARLKPVSRGPAARCGFCHGDLLPIEDAGYRAERRVTCEACSSVVHETCWKDHGRCPNLGCPGAAR